MRLRSHGKVAAPANTQGEVSPKQTTTQSPTPKPALRSVPYPISKDEKAPQLHDLYTAAPSKPSVTPSTRPSLPITVRKSSLRDMLANSGSIELARSVRAHTKSGSSHAGVASDRSPLRGIDSSAPPKRVVGTERTAGLKPTPSHPASSKHISKLPSQPPQRPPPPAPQPSHESADLCLPSNGSPKPTQYTRPPTPSAVSNPMPLSPSLQPPLSPRSAPQKTSHEPKRRPLSPGPQCDSDTTPKPSQITADRPTISRNDLKTDSGTVPEPPETPVDRPMPSKTEPPIERKSTVSQEVVVVNMEDDEPQGRQGLRKSKRGRNSRPATSTRKRPTSTRNRHIEIIDVEDDTEPNRVRTVRNAMSTRKRPTSNRNHPTSTRKRSISTRNCDVEIIDTEYDTEEESSSDDSSFIPVSSGESGNNDGPESERSNVPNPPSKKRRTGKKTRGLVKGTDMEKKRRKKGSPVPPSPASTSLGLLPNRFILKDGNTCSFRYTFQSGYKITFTQWDLYHTSLSRLLNDDGISVCADIMMRELGLGPQQGFEWIHESHCLAKTFSSPPTLNNMQLQIPRWQAILGSKTLFVPVFRDKHWSILVISNCSALLKRILDIGPSGKRSKASGPIQLVAAHFDSLKSLGHSDIIENVKLFLVKGILVLWKHTYRDEQDAYPPNVERIVDTSLKIVNGKVEQQDDGLSCGWRAIRHAMHIAERGVDSPTSLKEVAGSTLNLSYQESAIRCISEIMKLSRPSSTDIPTMLYPLHSVVDEHMLSFFEATPINLSEKVISHLETSRKEGASSASKRTNATKKAQWEVVSTVSKNVVDAMKAKDLHKIQTMHKETPLSDAMCLEVAKYLFHLPCGKHFAECLYYTRHSYPDSFLVCVGVNVLFNPTPRIFGHSIPPVSSRSKRSTTVHYQMSMIRDHTRGSVRYYDEVARFRMVEMAEHFKGVAEALLKACCKLAKSRCDQMQGVADVRTGGKPEQGEDMNLQEHVTKNMEDVDLDRGDERKTSGWDFCRSVTLHNPTGNELGTIRCNVSARDLGEEIGVCLKSADKVANEAIMSCVCEFEKRCKREIQISRSSVKISKMKNRVTGRSLAAIPTLFANKFVKLLKEEVQENWGTALPTDFFDGDLDVSTRRLLSAADSLFRRNGSCFLDLKHEKDVLDDVLVQHRANRSMESSRAKAPSNPEPPPTMTEDGVVHVQRVESSVTAPKSTPQEFVSFSLGADTDLYWPHVSVSAYIPYQEFLSLFFHVLRDCRCHVRSDACQSGVSEIQTSVREQSLCQKLAALQQSYHAAMRDLERSGSESWCVQDVSTLRRHIQEAKLNILRRATALIGDTADPKASSDAVAFRSNIFCCKEPVVDSFFNSVTEGKSFTIFFGNGQGSTDVKWAYEALSMTCHKMTDQSLNVFRSQEADSLLCGINIPTSKIPKLYKLEANLGVHCTLDLWDETAFEVRGDQFLGFKMFDIVKVAFSFQKEGRNDPDRHPLHTNYSHCFLGVVCSHPTVPTKAGDGTNTASSNDMIGTSGTDYMRLRCVGPKSCDLMLMVQDDLAISSGCEVTLPQVINRWKVEGFKNTICSIIPLDDMDIRKEIYQFSSLEQLSFAPKIFRLALLDSRFAESYEVERRKKHYQLMKTLLPDSPFQYRDFKSRKQLEVDWKEQLRQAVRPFDSDLNGQQLQVIETVLYGWKTDMSPNGAEVLEQMSEKIRHGITTSGIPALDTISKDDFAWWGSNMCYMEGPPGSGKTRTIAALICTVLQKMEAPSALYDYIGPPRVLIITATDAAADELFVRICNIFRQMFANNIEKYDTAVSMMVRVGTSFGRELVNSREVFNVAGNGSAPAVVSRARAVFTTASDLYRDELVKSQVPFSLLVIEDVGLLREESIVYSVCRAFVRDHAANQGFQRVSILFAGDRNQILPQEKKHFFDHGLSTVAPTDVSLRISLSRQYRTAPPITNFLSSTYYRGELSPAENGKLWEDDNLFTALRQNKRFPVRNLVVIDTSLDKDNAFDSFDSESSLYNKFEANLVSAMLTNWTHGESKEALQNRITVLSMYPRQRLEISQRLHSANLNRVEVRSLHQLMGLENDIIIISLVRTRPHLIQDVDEQSPSFVKEMSDAQWIRTAISRARKAVIVVCFARHIAEQSPQWTDFFRYCVSRSQNRDDATHGYFRPRYIEDQEDVNLAPFSPPFFNV